MHNRSLSQEEQWVRWEPGIQGLSAKYYSESVDDDVNGLTFIISDAKEKEKKIMIFFNHPVFSYQMTEESSAVNRFYDLLDKYGRDFIHKWAFFKIRNSSYSQFIAEQSQGKIQAEDVTHFMLFTIDFMIDVISLHEPLVEWLPLPSKNQV